MRSCSVTVIAVVALAIAASATRAIAQQVQPSPGSLERERSAPTLAKPATKLPPRRWVHPADEVPEMWLELLPDGKARLIGGLTFHNPARWTYDASAGELRLKLARVNADTRAVFEDGVRRGHALRYQPADSVLVLRWRPGVGRLWLAGYFFMADSTPRLPLRRR